MPPKSLPSQEILNELLRFDPKSGLLYWKVRKPEHFKGVNSAIIERDCNAFNSRYALKEALAYIDFHGYKVGKILNKKRRAHRVIWKMVNNQEPSEIDHIDGNGLNNKIDNLRAADRKINTKNSSMSCTNTSGVTGVIWHKRMEKWQARINSDGKRYNLGSFKTIEEAAKVRKAADKKYEFHENHGRK